MAGEKKRIQNAANRSGQGVTVVGSRVNPNTALRPDSDYDFVIDANNKTRNNLSRSLPGGKKCEKDCQIIRIFLEVRLIKRNLMSPLVRS